MLLLTYLAGCYEVWKLGDGDGDGVLANEGDCNDDDPNVYWGNEEIWYNGIDENCDTNDGDQDGDFYVTDDYAAEFPDWATRFPRRPDTPLLGAGDCDDTDANFNPGITVDNYSTLPPETCGEVTLYCDDSDNDGSKSSVGTTYTYQQTIEDPSLVERNCTADLALTDCNDEDATVYPTAAEICDGIDNDCDGAIEETVSAYEDKDSDTFGSSTAAAVFFCESDEVPLGFSLNNTDCDDDDTGIYPGAPDVCDGADNDCNGAVDDDVSLHSTYYADKDADTFGNNADSIVSCYPDSTRKVLVGGDCDDADENIYPGATETSFDNIDQDCGDTDGNGYDDDTDGDYGVSSIDLADVFHTGRLGFGEECGTAVAATEAGGFIFTCPTYSNRGDEGAMYHLFDATKVDELGLESPTLAGLIYGTTGDQLGGAVYTLQDVNGDGFNEFCSSSKGSTSKGGLHCVESNSVSPTGYDISYEVQGSTNGDLLGSSAASSEDGLWLAIGSTNDDAGATNGGCVTVMPTSLAYGLYTSDVLAPDSYLVCGDTSNDNVSTVQFIHDFDGDSIEELVIGAPRDDTAGSDAGAIAIYSGADTIEGTTQDFGVGTYAFITGDAAGDRLNLVNTVGGDWDGDGLKDIVVSKNDGSVSIVTGGIVPGTQSLSTLPRTDFSSSSLFISSFNYVGDVNDDGHTDVAMGDPDSSAYAGIVCLALGDSGFTTTWDFTKNTICITGNMGDEFGTSISGAEDLNSDGFDDFLVGAPGYSTADGSVSVFFGGTQ